MSHLVKKYAPLLGHNKNSNGGACAGVITGVVSFVLLHAIKWACDKLSARTNGAFGYCTPPQSPEGSAHSAPDDEFNKAPAKGDDSVSNGAVRRNLLSSLLLHVQSFRSDGAAFWGQCLGVPLHTVCLWCVSTLVSKWGPHSM
jgi:hypothetical protein